MKLQDMEIPGQFLLSVEETGDTVGESRIVLDIFYRKTFLTVVTSYFLGQSQLCYVPTCCCLISKFPYFHIAKDCLSRYLRAPKTAVQL